MRKSYWEVLKETWSLPALILVGVVFAGYSDGDLGWTLVGAGVVLSLITWFIGALMVKLSLDVYVKFRARR